jgi:hypothetical protein
MPGDQGRTNPTSFFFSGRCTNHRNVTVRYSGKGSPLYISLGGHLSDCAEIKAGQAPQLWCLCIWRVFEWIQTQQPPCSTCVPGEQHFFQIRRTSDSNITLAGCFFLQMWMIHCCRTPAAMRVWDLMHAKKCGLWNDAVPKSAHTHTHPSEGKNAHSYYHRKFWCRPKSGRYPMSGVGWGLPSGVHGADKGDCTGKKTKGAV